MEGDSDARRAIETAGLSVRDYVLATLALGQALAAQDTTGPIRFRNVPPENVAFVRERRDIVQRLRDERRLRVHDVVDTDRDRDERKDDAPDK
jgi:hypothetical protein